MNKSVSLPGLVRQRAESMGDDVALSVVEHESRYTWSDLHLRSTAWSAMLARLGVGTGDVVATMLSVGDQAAVSWIGTAGLGALEAPLNHAFKGDWLRRVLSTIDPRAIVIDERFCAAWEPLLKELTVPVLVAGGAGRPGFLSASELLAESTRTVPMIDGGLGDPACVILTSGTTGRSKGVVVPWGRCAGTLPVAEALDPDGNGTYYNPFPTFHWSARGPVYRAAARGTSLVTREGFKTSAWLHDVRRFGCTDTLLIGAMMSFLMSSSPLPDDADNPIRACIGGPVPPFIEDFAARFGIDRVVATYGMSEIVNVFLTPPGTSVTAQTYQSCGKEAGFPVRIVRDDDTLVADNEIGELQVGGDKAALNLGYLNDPDATAQAWTKDGWFKTGDLFRRDADGYYYFVDRLKDALRRRGENISSTEVEEMALKHPAVAECAIVAVPSEWSEDEVMIFVVLAEGATVSAEELTDFMAEHVPAFAVPRFVEFLNKLPKTPSLKIQKSVLRSRGRSTETWDRSQDSTRSTINQ
ncbi:AMP-binding protein [Rhodococcus sp. MS16]|uniref:AMP-binding protein n=1 Tax=Rhodococcus sp. MS16 TaxID=2579941 RepID=UPI0023DDE8F8|nr:AMP-binding protein [Rhodococcus sp. MS16]